MIPDDEIFEIEFYPPPKDYDSLLIDGSTKEFHFKIVAFAKLVFGDKWIVSCQNGNPEKSSYGMNWFAIDLRSASLTKNLVMMPMIRVLVDYHDKKTWAFQHSLLGEPQNGLISWTHESRLNQPVMASDAEMRRQCVKIIRHLKTLEPTW